MSTATEYTPELIERFYSKVSTIPTEQGCLEWMAYHNADGYGAFGVGPHKPKGAHRVAWEIVNGPIPAGMVIRHFICNNPRCCNVEHLRLGTRADNIQDMMRSGRWMNAPNTATPYVKPTAIERFYEKVSKTPTDRGCLEWLASCYLNGYGQYRIGGKNCPSHRVAWTLANGPIPDGMFVCHQCDNPRCCRIEHLFLGTPADNMRDRDTKGRNSPLPIFTGEQHPKAKLTTEQVLEIRSEKFLGWKRYEIAQYFGISSVQVSNIILRKNWTHI